MRRGAVLVGASVVLAAAVLTAAGPAGGTWVQQSIPSAGRTSFVRQVSCPTLTACFAVGNEATPPGPGLGLVESWNGSTWTAQLLPDNDSESVFGVSCSGAKACTAVGNVGLPPLVDRWNGSAWVSQQAKFPSGAFGASFWAVSCPAANACEVTGNWQKTGFSGPVMLLAERWNGSGWTIQATPAPSGTKPILDGVSCPAVSTCIAVGDYTRSGTHTQVTLAEEWNGTSWTILPTVNQGSGQGNGQLDAVSCTSATACTAVGSYNANSMELTLAETWNGTKWAAQPTPNPSGATGSVLEGVSCPTSTTCTATGQTVIKNGGGTLAEAVVGGAWVLQSTPSPAKLSFLSGVSCVSAICIAVGGTDSNFGLGTVPVAEERS